MQYYTDELENQLDNKKLIIFINWYLKGQNEEEWNKVQKELHIKMSMQKALDTYLKRIDVQNAIVQATKITKDFDFIRVYRNMLDKALKGDQKSADWILRANNSDFFKDNKNTTNELDEIVKGLDLNE